MVYMELCRVLSNKGAFLAVSLLKLSVWAVQGVVGSSVLVLASPRRVEGSGVLTTHRFNLNNGIADGAERYAVLFVNLS
jgi:hypothetical protein